MERSSLPTRVALPLVIAFLVGACAVPQDTSPTPTGATSSVAALPTPSASAPALTASASPDPDRPLVPPEVLAENTTPHPVRAISAGWGICAIREDATIACWNDRERPPEGRFVAIDSAGGSTCAIRDDASLACWGEIGPEVPDGTYRAVSVGQGAACAIRDTDDGLTCWTAPDDPDEPDEDDSDATPDPASRPVDGPVTAVSIGDFVDCAIREDGHLACWAAVPEDIPALPEGRVRAIDLPCLIHIDGELECLETVSESGSMPPEDGTYTTVSTYSLEGRGCAVRQDQALVCWGDEGFDDQTGNGRPMRTPPGVYTAVTVGETAACATRPDGIAVCWGEDDEGVRPAPTMRFDAPMFATDPRILLRWDALPAFGAITWYDIDLVTGRNEDGDAITWEPWRAATPSTSGVFEGTPGGEHCWRARAHDTDGRTSIWGGGCTTMPHDENVFEPSGSWVTVRDPRYYLGSALRTTERGASLSIDVDVFGLALFATTCPDCGSIRVITSDGDEEVIDLASKGRHDRELVWHGDNGQAGYFKEEGNGHIVIEVTSTGRPVLIDGLLQGPSLDG